MLYDREKLNELREIYIVQCIQICSCDNSKRENLRISSIIPIRSCYDKYIQTTVSPLFFDGVPQLTKSSNIKAPFQ